MTKWTWTNASYQFNDNKVRIAFSPELEEVIKRFLNEAFGIHYLKAERTITDEGLIELTFEANPDDAADVGEALKRQYLEEIKVSSDN